MTLHPYNRKAAVTYAHQWAYGRNPDFYNYEQIGGDCTNFASQCLLAGTGVMNFTPDFGWYYQDANQKSPSWTGVPYLFDFLTRDVQSAGPVGKLIPLSKIRPGDLVQLSFDGVRYQHTPIVVAVWKPSSSRSIWVAAHSTDADNRSLQSYPYRKLRCIRIAGYYGD